MYKIEYRYNRASDRLLSNMTILSAVKFGENHPVNNITNRRNIYTLVRDSRDIDGLMGNSSIIAYLYLDPIEANIAERGSLLWDQDFLSNLISSVKQYLRNKSIDQCIE